jgi:hypothetical protein
MAMLARIKPYNPKRGHLVRRYMVKGIRFDVNRGWYKVDEALADYLKTVTQNPNDPDTPPVFDVLTEAAARELEEAEEAARKPAPASAPLPGTLTTADLPRASADAPATAAQKPAPVASTPQRRTRAAGGGDKTLSAEASAALDKLDDA